VVKTDLRPRLAALGRDYLVILGWLALLAAVFVPLYLSGVRPFDGLSTAGGDLLIALLTVLPAGAYLTIGEAGRHRATWGKRRSGLTVATTGGQRPGLPRIVARNVVKLLPWQLAHLAGSRLAAGDDGTVLLVATYALAGLSIALLLVRRDRAALHDLVTGTRVVRA